MDLYNTEAQNLDTFIAEHLQPNEVFLNQDCKKIMNFICDSLKATGFSGGFHPKSRVSRVVKGGSLWNGTALKGGSDAILVAFLDNLKCFGDQKEKILILRRQIQATEKKLMEEVRKFCGQGLQLVSLGKKNWCEIRFKLLSDDSTYIECDVLLAFDAIGHNYGPRNTLGVTRVYLDLIKSISHGGEFSRCFTELQTSFIASQPPKLRDLIRLVKYWYEKYGPKKTQLKRRESLPPEYALQLLTVYAWEQGSKETDFNMAEGFWTVLWLIQQHEKLCIVWTINYDFQNETLKGYLQSQLRKPRPIILDPADPTWIVGKGSRWDLVAKNARICASKKCCTSSDGSVVRHWDVPLQVCQEEAQSYCTVF